MPRYATILTVNERPYPLDAEQLYVMVSDFRGHHQRIIPSVLARSSYRVTGGPDIDTMVIEATVFEGGASRPLRLDVEEIEPGAAFRLVETRPSKWTQFRVRAIGDGLSALELTMSHEVPAGIRFLVHRLLVSQTANRIAREVLDNVETYRQTLGSTITASTGTVSVSSLDDRD